MQLSLNIPSQLNRVATLPCDLCQKNSVSCALYSLAERQARQNPE